MPHACSHKFSKLWDDWAVMTAKQEAKLLIPVQVFSLPASFNLTWTRPSQLLRVHYLITWNRFANLAPLPLPQHLHRARNKYVFLVLLYSRSVMVMHGCSRPPVCAPALGAHALELSPISSDKGVQHSEGTTCEFGYTGLMAPWLPDSLPLVLNVTGGKTGEAFWITAQIRLILLMFNNLLHLLPIYYRSAFYEICWRTKKNKNVERPTSPLLRWAVYSVKITRPAESFDKWYI